MQAMTEQPIRDIGVQEIWVNVTEAAEIIGYHPDYVRKLARDNWNVPENERKLLVQRHTGGYMFWLPDLMDYISNKNRTAPSKPKHTNT